MSRGRLHAVLATLALALIGAGTAYAHQIAVNNGVVVTLHVAPNDEPIAGQPALILVPKVKTRTGKFAWTTCRCTLKVSDSSGATLLKGAATPRQEFTFPEPAAYQIDFAGRVLRKGKWVPFKVSFGIRAFATE